ncbi:MULTISPECIES: hypothetical protein [unclassified Streptomyces]|uniref:hypothetical protein n=1 Tax=unclassified Streptomyces TaxID=2593676 RepID=UPI0011146CD9|nr:MULTISPECIES: hypothetical protein [unclassified Streptomyces]
MERVVEERLVDTHKVMIVEDAEDEGSGYLLIVDGVLADEAEPLNRIPTDTEIRALIRAQRLD